MRTSAIIEQELSTCQAQVHTLYDELRDVRIKEAGKDLPHIANRLYSHLQVVVGTVSYDTCLAAVTHVVRHDGISAADMDRAFQIVVGLIHTYHSVERKNDRHLKCSIIS